MVYNKAGDTLVHAGANPLLLEPVNFSLQLPDGNKKYFLEPLDQDGLRTGRTVQIRNTKVKIGGAEEKTIWYLIEKVQVGHTRFR